MANVTEVAENIFMIDNNLFSIPRWGSVYLMKEQRNALVETGPTTSVPSVLEGIKELGLEPEDIHYLIVTHIHLDHAGGAGVLSKMMPKSRVVVHNKGLRHMMDPSRLVQSATQTRGDELLEMHGEVEPVHARQMLPVNNGDEFSLSDKQTLMFMDTPGHAPHHMCIHESRNNGIFTGDALSLYVGDIDLLLPYHPPVQFDLDQCLKTLDRLDEMAPDIVYYSHFGVTRQVHEHIVRAREKLLNWDSIVRKAFEEGTFGDAKQMLIDQAHGDLEPMKDDPALAALYNYLVTKSIPMSAEGHMAYYRKLFNVEA